MNTKLLRQKVLDLAIHGKLVPQNPEHEPASKLLERIRGESLPLATAGKPSSAAPSPRGKAPKTPSAPISEDEIPFEIPKNWCWCRTNNICKVYGRIGFRGYTKDDLVDEGNGAVSLSPSNIRNMSLDFSQCTYLSWFKYDESPEIQLQINDIVVVKTGSSYGKSALVDKLPIATTLNPQLMVLKNINCNSKYLCYLLNTSYFKKIFEELVNGTAIPTFSQEKFGNKIIPLPPLEEQKLIVEEIERIFALIDTVEQNKTDLETVIKQTKSKILDLAIHGKLVPQDKTDEPASKMLEKLRAEKEEKIANGQLKRDKNDSYIYKSANGKWLERKADGSEEEIEVPFEIPESWAWCRLPSVCRRNITDGTHNSPPTNDKGEFLYITAKNIKLSGIDLSNVSYVSKEIHDVIYGRCPVELNDVLLTKDGTIGEVTVNNLDYPFSLLSSVALIKPSNIVESWFITYVLKSDYMQNIMKGSSKGVALKRIILEQINQLLIPIPPLEEQKRIVLKVKQIYKILSILY